MQFDINSSITTSASLKCRLFERTLCYISVITPVTLDVSAHPRQI